MPLNHSRWPSANVSWGSLIRCLIDRRLVTHCHWGLCTAGDELTVCARRISSGLKVWLQRKSPSGVKITNGPWSYREGCANVARKNLTMLCLDLHRPKCTEFPFLASLTGFVDHCGFG
jgi:hypothetical protein